MAHFSRLYRTRLNRRSFLKENLIYCIGIGTPFPVIHQSEARPWVTSPPMSPLKSSQSKVVEFPEEDESIGEYVLSCFGPDVNVYLDISDLIS